MVHRRARTAPLAHTTNHQVARCVSSVKWENTETRLGWLSVWHAYLASLRKRNDCAHVTNAQPGSTVAVGSLRVTCAQLVSLVMPMLANVKSAQLENLRQTQYQAMVMPSATSVHVGASALPVRQAAHPQAVVSLRCVEQQAHQCAVRERFPPWERADALNVRVVPIVRLRPSPVPQQIAVIM